MIAVNITKTEQVFQHDLLLGGRPGVALGLGQHFHRQGFAGLPDEGPLFEVVVAEALQVDAVDRVGVLHFVATPAALAGHHEQFEAGRDVVLVIAGRLEAVAHGDRVFRADVGAAAAVRAAPADVFHDPDLLADIEHENLARRAVVRAARAADALVDVEDRPAPEALRDGFRLRGIGKGDPPRLQAQDRFLDFA